MLRPLALVVSWLGFGALCGPVLAQCATVYLPSIQLPGTDGVVRAVTVWDRDGSGPLPPLIVVGGLFTQVGAVAANSIAAYDPITGVWSALGGGFGSFQAPGEVRALAARSSGDLFVGGDFSMVGGVTGYNHIARFDGRLWSALSSGTATPVDALAVMPNGDVVAGGDFTIAGGVTVDRIARWNGAVWQALGSGLNNRVRALTPLANGDVVAGGDFTMAGGLPANRVARFNGTWSALGSGMGGIVRALTTQGTLVWAGGDFSSAGGMAARGVASWNGTTWQANINGLVNPTRVHALAATATDIFIAGINAGAGAFNSTVARFDGSFWQGLESNNSSASIAYAMTLLPDGRLCTGGAFDNVNRVPAFNVALGPLRWMAAGVLSGFIADAAARPDGTLVVTGEFTAPGIGVTSLATWDGVRWTSHQASIVGSARVAIGVPDGDIAVSATDFNTSANRVYRWDGATWTQLGAPTAFSYTALAVLQNGDLVAGGYDGAGNTVIRWNGSSWVPLGSLPPRGVDAMVVLANGDLAVSQTFSGSLGVYALDVWRFSGATWSQVGARIPNIRDASAMTVLPNGDLVVGGQFPVHRWDGTSWAPLGTDAPYGIADLLQLPNGDLLAVGTFTSAGLTIARRIARWDGASWGPIGAGADGDVRALAALPQGDLALLGTFARIGGAPSPGFVRLSTTCPASAVSVGAPCNGTAGPMQLRADALPWVGGSFRATATGLATGALGLSILGVQPAALPLSSLHPVGDPLCSLLVSPTFVSQLSHAAGQAALEFAIPNSLALVGGRIHSQVLQMELSGSMVPTLLTGTNALLLGVGAF